MYRPSTDRPGQGLFALVTKRRLFERLFLRRPEETLYPGQATFVDFFKS